MQRAQGEFGAFDWNEEKRQSNLQKHGIDFEDAVIALRQPHVEYRSDRQGEIRTVAICPDSGKLIAVVYTMRDDICRIISARAARKMNNENITRTTAEEILAKRHRGEASQTDWARVNALTDEDIERAMRDDPDWAEFIDIDWSKAEWVVPVVKKPLSIRLDQDIVDFFQATGKGYQTRINAVLRHYMAEEKRRQGK